MSARGFVRPATVPAAAVGLGLLVSACAVVTGLDDYTLSDLPASSSGDAGDGGAAPDVVVVPPADDSGPPPPACAVGEVSCTGAAGATANACVDGAWKTTRCEQTCTDGACDVYPSCRDATGSGCGANPLSCCATRAVPGGTFLRRNDPTLPATVSPFRLDVFEVTVGRFRAFLAAGGATQARPPAPGAGKHPKLADSGWHAEWNVRLPVDVGSLKSSLNGGKATWTDVAGANEHRPINNVPWLEAFAFCAWDGGRLPTYAELSFAATGGDEQRVYPWSAPPASTTLSGSPAVEAAFNCNYQLPIRSCGTSCSGCDLADIAPVGSLPAGAGKWGQLDLGGNVREWALDLADPPSEARPPAVCNDCAVVLTTDPERAVIGTKEFTAEFYSLGGAFDANANGLRASAWEHDKYRDAKEVHGFRCARDAD